MEPKLLTADRFVDPETGISYRYIYSETEYFRPHYHDYYEIFLTLQGNAIHMVNGKRFLLKERTLVLIRPADCHDYICENGPYSMLNITFSAQTAQAMFSYLGDGFQKARLLDTPLPPQRSLSKSDTDRIEQSMRAIRALKPVEHQKRKTALRILLLRLMDDHFFQSQTVEKQMPAWLEEMCAKLREGGFNQGSEYFFSLTDKTREHVSRSMKQYVGMTVSEFINDLRLNYIANMLRNSNHSVTEIIFESGFNNISWAGSQFKKRYGMTMREYRKQS